MHPARPIRIAIVDDTADLRLVCSLVFGADERFEVVGEAPDGAGAIALVDAVDPDVILVDLGLPDIDGLEVIRTLARREERPVLVVLTGSAEPGAADEAMEVGADAWFTKTTGPQELVDPLVALYRDLRERDVS